MERYIEFLDFVGGIPSWSLSPELIRRIATKVGYTNSKVITVFQQIAELNQGD